MADSRKRRRRSSHAEKLLINEAVEVRSVENGLQGSWHPAKIIVRERKQCLVKYDHLVCDDQKEYLSEYVDISSSINGICCGLESSSNYRGKIRPTPPKVDLSMPLQYSMCVDAYYQDAWWEGVVFDHQEACGEWKLFFPDKGDELSISTDNLRLTQDWNEATGEWSLRGKWLFLEIIDELKPEYVAPVSIKQMWYDLRKSQKFHRVKEWTFQGKSVWKALILEVINDYLGIIADEFVSTKNLSQEQRKRNHVESVESIYCPEAITEYLQYWDVHLRTMNTKSRWDLSEKARKHLSAIGWELWSKMKNGRPQARYTSLEKKAYYSLRTACKAALDAAPSSGPPQVFSKDAQSRVHVSCLCGRGGVNLDGRPKGKWFCCRTCAKGSSFEDEEEEEDDDDEEEKTATDMERDVPSPPGSRGLPIHPDYTYQASGSDSASGGVPWDQLLDRMTKLQLMQDEQIRRSIEWERGISQRLEEHERSSAEWQCQISTRLEKHERWSAKWQRNMEVNLAYHANRLDNHLTAVEVQVVQLQRRVDAFFNTYGYWPPSQ